MPEAAGRIRRMLGLDSRAVDDASRRHAGSGHPPWRGRAAVPEDRENRRGTPQHDDRKRVRSDAGSVHGSACDERDAGSRRAVRPTPAASDGHIAIDDFMKVELRVAKVLEAEAVPKSKKLIKLRVDAGTEQRTILAGIAEAYQPDQLVGRTIVIVANLKPRPMMGMESQGMVLAASTEGGPPSLVAVDPESASRRARAVIDSHCHLAGDEFTADLDAVVGRAKDAGLSGALVILGAEDQAELARASARVERLA